MENGKKGETAPAARKSAGKDLQVSLLPVLRPALGPPGTPVPAEWPEPQSLVMSLLGGPGLDFGKFT